MKARGRTPDVRRIKSRYAYTTFEAADVLGVHRNTVRNWLREGLASLNEKRPILMLGADLKAFLSSRRKARRRPCEAGQIFCIKCRSPKVPAFGMSDYVPISSTLGSLVGLCPDCGMLIRRWTSLARLEDAKGQLEVKITAPQKRLSGTASPPSNCHFEQGAKP
jgi:hypothetical protein